MENVVKYFNTVESSFRKTKVVTVCAVVMAAVISIGSLVYSASYIASHNDNIYLLDSQGGALSATVSDGSKVNRGLEVESVVTRFHEYMYNMTPSKEAIERNLELAMALCDGSAYEYYTDQQENGFYSKLISTNTLQYIIVDSVRVNMDVYPYQERTYGRLYVMRASNITTYNIETVGQVVETGRSKTNPNGLMIEKFSEQVKDNAGTRLRR